MTLYDETRHLHHACERHVVGQVMADGSISAQWWVDWLAALRVLHEVVDPVVPPCLQRCASLSVDMFALRPTLPRPSLSAQTFASSRSDEKSLAGAAYVLTGAHLMGGAVMAKRLGGRLPTGHTVYDDRPAAIAELREMRERKDLGQAARETFGALLCVMDEIVRLDSQ